MSLELLHRRLVVGMGLVALAAFAGGAGFEPISTILAALALTLALIWQPNFAVSLRLERLWLPVAIVLLLRSLYHIFLVGDDVVIPVVDLLLLLLCAEALRSLDAPNEVELYLQFRESCRRAGFRADQGVAPLSLLDELARARHPAYWPAQSVVDHYLRARFGDQNLDLLERREMKSDLADVRRALRRTRAPTDAPPRDL